MSANEVRWAVKTFIEQGNIDGLAKVYRAAPYYISGANWQLPASIGNGSIAFVHLGDDSEDRESFPGVLGLKDDNYDVIVVVCYQYKIPSGAMGPHEPDDWVDGLDAVLDGIKARLHSDPALGAPALISQAGQEPGDIRTSRQLPRVASGFVLSWSQLHFSLTEVIVA